MLQTTQENWQLHQEALKCLKIQFHRSRGIFFLDSECSSFTDPYDIRLSFISSLCHHKAAPGAVANFPTYRLSICKERGLEKHDHCPQEQKHRKLLTSNKLCLSQMGYIFIKDMAGLYFIYQPTVYKNQQL